MATTTLATTQQSNLSNRIFHGDCIEVMRQMPTNSVDFILTDPPYLVNYRDRSGRTIQNDVDESWLKPAMAESYRVLKQDRVAVMFYGWTKVDAFFDAWRSAGFQPVGHIVFRKSYSSKSRFLRYQHEQAFLLAKGRPPLPKQPLGDVMDMPYSGNKLHPTQKPVPALAQLIRSFSLPGETVLDPFAGSGSRAVTGVVVGTSPSLCPSFSRSRMDCDIWRFRGDALGHVSLPSPDSRSAQYTHQIFRGRPQSAFTLTYERNSCVLPSFLLHRLAKMF
jgi:16S rRNA G966 N2-methylase RsmD